jgi:hypothetical protein
MDCSLDGGASRDEEDELSISTDDASAAWRVFAGLLVAVDGVVAAVYFYAEWQTYAQHHGATPDMGTALGAAFTSAYAIYTSLALVTVTLLAGVVGVLLGYRTRRVWVALAVACLPMASLLTR